MIDTIVRISWLNLARDRVALVLTFVLPIIFFSIFAAVFGGLDQGQLQPVATLLVVEDAHPAAEQLVNLVKAQPGLEILERGPRFESRESARAEIQRGRAAVAVVIPPGFGSRLADPAGLQPELEILTDGSNPVAAEVVSGLIWSSVLRLGADLLAADSAIEGTEGTERPLDLQVVDVVGRDDKRPSVAFFAAGIGVMFLLFALSGRSGILIEERERGVLSRLFAAGTTISDLLFGRWVFLTGLGCVQMVVMFIWAAIAFDLDLWTVQRAGGFALMTVASASAAAAFGLALASMCRSRAQLTGISSVVILILSALGGSMFPRFLMPEDLATIGRMAFNSWAVDGYQQVFWYEAATGELWPQLLVLFGSSVAFLAIAHLIARRWQVS